MFKKIIILAFIPTISFAQLTIPKIGIKVGTSFSTISSSISTKEYSLSEKHKTILKNPGVLLGLYTHSKERKFILENLFYGFKNEILYHQKGYKYTNIPVSYIRERFNYLEISSNLNVRLGAFSLHTGGYYAFLIGGKRLKYHEDLGYSSYEYDSFTFTNIDYGINIGSALSVNKSMTLNFRYAQGLINYNEVVNAQNITYQLTLEYLFPIEKTSN